MKEKRKYVLVIILLLLSLLSFCTYSSDVENLMVDIFSHFKLQYAFIFLTISVYCLVRREVLLSFVSLMLFLINIFSIWNFDSGVVYASLKYNDSFRIYSANINKDNKNFSTLMNEIRGKSPDIILLIEVRPNHLSALNPVIRDYRYKIFDPKIYTSNIGIVFLSRYPILKHNIINLSDVGNRIIRALLSIKGKDVVLYGVHLPRIGIDRSFMVRQKVFIKLASMIADESKPAIIAGDFNATPYSPVFKRFIEISKLGGLSKDYGWHPTWPALFPPLWIPIDHILVTQGIRVINKERGSYIGSDHYPIMASLSLVNKKD